MRKTARFMSPRQFAFLFVLLACVGSVLLTWEVGRAKLGSAGEASVAFALTSLFGGVRALSEPSIAIICLHLISVTIPIALVELVTQTQISGLYPFALLRYGSTDRWLNTLFSHLAWLLTLLVLGNTLTLIALGLLLGLPLWIDLEQCKDAALSLLTYACFILQLTSLQLLLTCCFKKMQGVLLVVLLIPFTAYLTGALPQLCVWMPGSMGMYVRSSAFQKDGFHLVVSIPLQLSTSAVFLALTRKLCRRNPFALIQNKEV